MRRSIQEHLNIILIALAASVFVFIIADIITGKTVRSSGEVVDKIYIKERIYPSIVSYSDGHGHLQTRTTIVHEPPEWKLMVRSSTGDVVGVTCAAHVFYQYDYGSSVPFVTRFGGLTGIPWLRRVVY